MIEIIRKIRIKSYVSLSINQEVADVLNWFSIDGLERRPNTLNNKNVIPYHITGFQAHKQDLLFSELIPIKRRAFEAHSLSLSEKCTLHFMLSTSVDYWERGDESKVCLNSPQEFRNMTVDGGPGMFSVCPLEGGVVLTSRGSVNAGRLLASLAAALMPQQVALSQLMTQNQLITHRLLPDDTVDNLWAATLAGDFAEVAVEQTPQYNENVNIGITGRWNDSYIPTRLYFNNVPFSIIENQQWQITDAEILAGIDGLLLGNMIKNRGHRMLEWRLSQILEMYYSNWSISENHVCNRKSAFSSLMNNGKKTLVEQSRRLAALLTTKTTTYYTDSSIMAYRCVKAVEKFMLYYPHLMVEDSCPFENIISPRVNLVVILDATWPPYSTLQFLMVLVKKIDINHYGGSITIVNGDSSYVRVNSTSNPSSIYQHMMFGRQNDPKGLILHKSFLALKLILEEENKREQALEYPRRATQDIVVVFGYSSTINDKDLEDSKDILQSIKNQNPALQCIFIANSGNSDRYRQLVNAQESPSNDAVISITDSGIESIVTLLQSKIRADRLLKPAYCKSDLHQWPEVWYNEFVTPHQTNSYWIHQDYLCGSLDIVKITFKNYNHGELFVCMSRGDLRGDCKVLQPDSEVTHALLRPCSQSAETCLPLYFTVNVLKTYTRCIEYECRYPNQVKFSIIVQDLHCINLNSDICSQAPYHFPFYSTIYIILISLVVIFV